jgi:hypothetical protein
MGLVTAAIVSTGISVGMGVASAVKANKDQRKFEAEKNKQEAILKDLEASRQDVINPMAGLTNEAEKIGVATQAARFQAEEADQALANTLDTLMATGSGSAGATALAQMALKSKQGISADIQKQELSNAVNIANSQQVINQQKAEGERFKWQNQEFREMDKLNRTANLMDKAEAQMYNAEAQKWAAYGNIAGSVTDGIGMVAGGINTNNMASQLDAAAAANNTTGTDAVQSTGPINS